MALTELQLHGTPALALQAADGARAVVALHGAHVVSWQPAGGHGEQLYLSPRSGFDAGQAIRGGVPVVFPQFSDRGPLPRHGFARTRAWRLLGASAHADGSASAVLGLIDDAQTRAVWPCAFALELQLRLSGQTLDIALQCSNTGVVPWQCATALHTYLRVQDCTLAGVAGLQGHAFWDALDRQDKTQDEAVLRFPGEVDRVYAGVDGAVDLHDAGDDPGRSVQVTHSGFADIVVWNPGPQRCAALTDMPADGYRTMVCIESARIAQPITLAPAQAWTGMQRVHLRA